MSEPLTLKPATPSAASEREAMRQFMNEGREPDQQWFFWCLKGQRINEYTKEPDGWEWPPRVSGRVAAKSKQEARTLIAQEFGEEYPMRVLRKDMVKFPFLLYIEPMDVGTTGERYIRRFMPTTCAECGVTFTLNDKYNDPRADSHAETCSLECRAKYRHRERAGGLSDGFSGQHPPVIYVITHKPTGQRYVGKTDQAFTLRWYQHMYHPGDSAFHRLVANSSVVDWQFEVVEHLGYILAECSGQRKEAYRSAVAAREQHWIDHFNSLNAGLNSVVAKKLEAEILSGLPLFDTDDDA